MAFFEEVFPLRIDFRPITSLPIYQIKATPRKPRVADEGATFDVSVRARDPEHARRIIGRYMPKLLILSIEK